MSASHNAFQSFKFKLAQNGYSGLSGVKKALGKMKDMSDADKKKALACAIEHFGGDAAAAPAPKAPRKAKKVAAAEPEAVAAPKTGRKKKAVAVEAAEATPVQAAPTSAGPRKKKAAKKVAAQGASELTSAQKVKRVTRALEELPPSIVERQKILEGKASVALEIIKTLPVNAESQAIAGARDEAARTLTNVLQCMQENVVATSGSQPPPAPSASALSEEERKRQALFDEARKTAIPVVGFPSIPTNGSALVDVGG